MTNREQLLYALKVQRLHELFVLKDDIHLQYKYKNINRARNQAATFQDKIIDAVIEDAVTGTSDPISSSTIKNNVEKIIDTNLRNDTKRISHDIPKKAVEAAVSNISNRYQFILGNRIREEIPNLQGKIEDYITTNNLGKLPEADLTEKLKAEYGTHAQKRIQNIIKDSFHTNECNLSWVKAVYDGYQYKSWNNGRTKRTRVWHKAKFIQSVPIDETFDIFGSYPARMMYPGDLNGGAENVANCRCWLSYSNRPPSDLRGPGKKTTTKSSKNKSNSSSKKSNNVMNKIKETIKKPVSKIKSKISNIKSKITKNNKQQESNSKINFSQLNFDNLVTKYNKDPNKTVTIDNKTVYGVNESSKDKLAFELEYGITKEQLNTEEYNFLKLYSGDGYSSLNGYYRERGSILNILRRFIIKRKYSKIWDETLKDSQFYMPFDKALNISNLIFDKGIILKEDLVVVRRQKNLMKSYANGDIYHSDSFLATSISENVNPDEYGKYINYIVIPKGTKILYLERITSTKHEYEVLVDKGVDLKLLKEASDSITHWVLI